MPTLMVSISGVRGLVGNGLDPKVLVEFTSAYAEFIGTGTVIIGRDSRITGEMVKSIVTGTLLAKGINVIDIGICPTPTVQFAVKNYDAQGGIAISASHNPNEWNALKLLNGTGQFLSPEEYSHFSTFLNKSEYVYNRWDTIGKFSCDAEAITRHKEAVLSMPIIDRAAIAKRRFRVVADCVNGAGFKIIPELLRDLGCEVIEMNCESTGIFPRLPEPLPENLIEIMKRVKDENVDVGIVVDPDVDRLVLITDEGLPFGEENTITQAVRFVLSKTPGAVAVNLSTTRAVEDVAKSAGQETFRSPVGEANVVKKMKEVGAVIGGEGSGGVIYPALHYGRDALVGIALTLQHLLEFGGTITQLKNALPQYSISKKKIELGNADAKGVLAALVKEYAGERISTEDGLRIDLADHWVHIRTSNTEPIMRVICEAPSMEEAESHVSGWYNKITAMLG